MSTVTIHVGSNLDVLPYRLSPNSVDAIVTDPPYELGFMGKSWDASGIAYNVELWKQCLRVLKPGGHLLAFSGSRTYHRMTCAIEDAGFEVRDQIMWVYGSGFPKSLDVSKAIDKKRNDWSDIEKIVRFLEAERQRSGVSRKQVEQHFGTVNIGQAFFTITPGSKPRVPMWEQWLSLKSLLCFDDSMDSEVWRLNGRKGKPGQNWERREVVGRRMAVDTTKIRISCSLASQGLEKTEKREISITTAATDAAKQWDGWGTALKPAHEPICVARKPLEGTVADNVMKWGTGALNIDASRVGFVSEEDKKESTAKNQHADFGTPPMTGNVAYGDYSMVQPKNYNPPGRWPANLIHDGSQEVLELFPETGISPKPYVRTKSAKSNLYSKTLGSKKAGDLTKSPNDSGSAARFFYCPKASKKDRDDGCEGMEERVFSMSGNDSEKEGDIGLNKSIPRRNFHPTVKPTDLMRYLCRLVTPPGGTVLDPFMGSGSTGRGAVLEGFDFIGIELSDEYAAIAKARIDAALSK